MKNASVGRVPMGKGRGSGKAGSKGMHAAAAKYTNRARATSRATSNV